MRALPFPRRLIAALAAAAIPALPATAGAYHSVGTPEQIAWVRRAAGNFVSAELARDGAAACAILNAPLRATVHHQTCEQRMDARLARLLHRPGARSGLRAERRAASSAVVVVHGNRAEIELPHPLLSGPNHFLWTENCWMLEG
jgi:hypothetical protein